MGGHEEKSTGQRGVLNGEQTPQRFLLNLQELQSKRDSRQLSQLEQTGWGFVPSNLPVLHCPWEAGLTLSKAALFRQGRWLNCKLSLANTPGSWGHESTSYIVSGAPGSNVLRISR